MISTLIPIKSEKVLEWFKYSVIMFTAQYVVVLMIVPHACERICIMQFSVCILKMSVMLSHLRLFANLPYSSWFLFGLGGNYVTETGVLKVSNKLDRNWGEIN